MQWREILVRLVGMVHVASVDGAREVRRVLLPALHLLRMSQKHGGGRAARTLNAWARTASLFLRELDE